MAATITPESVWAHIPPRARDSHKGSFGAVLVVAGSACYRGAASLAVEGALRTGAGIVTLASVEPVLAAVSSRLPECCLCPCEAGAEGGIAPESIPRIRRQKATVLLLGPGLGYTAQSAAALHRQRCRAPVAGAACHSQHSPEGAFVAVPRAGAKTRPNIRSVCFHTFYTSPCK